jgi:hypothetical protein
MFYGAVDMGVSPQPELPPEGGDNAKSTSTFAKNIKATAQNSLYPRTRKT